MLAAKAENNRKKKTTHFSVNLPRSLVIYQAAQCCQGNSAHVTYTILRLDPSACTVHLTPHQVLSYCYVCAAKAHLLAAKERQAAAAQSEEPAAATAARGSDRQDRGGADRQDRGDTAHYLQDVKSRRAQMRKPTEGSSLSWR